MKTKQIAFIFFIARVALYAGMTAMLVSCHKHEVLDDEPVAIVFASQLAETGTKASSVSLSDYVQQFQLFGMKQKSNYELVFNNYSVTYQSNTESWAYDLGAQTIKYWDFSASRYCFSAVAGNPANQDFIFDADQQQVTYTTEVANADLNETFYYSDFCSVPKSDFANVVTLKFTPYVSRVRIGFYEVIPDFTVSNLTFGSATDPDHLIAQSSFIDGGTFQLVYDYATSTQTLDFTPSTTSTTCDFGAIQYSGSIGTASDQASYALGGGATQAYYKNLFPHKDNDQPLSLRCSYVATSITDGTSTDILDIPVTVPSEFVQWKPGFEYTYLFKISDNEISFTGVNEVAIKSWTQQPDIEHSVYNW